VIVLPATYEPIASVNGTGSSDTISFTSIPGTYTDLVVIARGRISSGSDAILQFNTDIGNNYSTTILYGTGTTAGSYRETSQARILADFYGYPADNNNHIGIYHIMNYANTTTNKTVLCRSNNAETAAGVDATVGLWRSTAAITSVQIKNTGNRNWYTDSTFALYGIKAA
jgi:hypothetical protein